LLSYVNYNLTKEKRKMKEVEENLVNMANECGLPTAIEGILCKVEYYENKMLDEGLMCHIDACNEICGE